MNDNDSFGAFFAGFVIGGLVGAAAALLMAPQSGEETRAQIQERGIELQTKAQEGIRDARVRADEALSGAQERGRVVYQEQRGKLESRLSEGKKAFQEQRVKLEGAVAEGKKKVETRIKKEGEAPPVEAPPAEAEA
jgi:gas vesicle protein